MIKNTASQRIGAQMVTASDGSAFTGSVTVAVTIDAGTQATGSVGSGACAHEGGGYHTYAPAQAETNGNLLAFTFSGTGAVPVTVQVFTVGYDPTAAQLPANVTQFGGTNLTATGGRPEVNVSHWLGTAAATPTVAGVPEVDVTHWIGTAAATPTVAGVPEVDVTHFGGSAGTFVSGRPNANASHIGGTSQTGRDIGASVLLSSGTGTGQVSLSSGAVLLQATQTGVTIPTVTTLTNAPSDSSGVTTLLSRIPSGLFTGITSLAQWLGLIAGKQTGNSTARTELRATGAGSGTFDETTDSLESLRDDMATDTEIAAAVWDEDLTGHTTPDSAGDILGNVATGTPPTAEAIADEVQTRTIAAVTTVNGLANDVITAASIHSGAVTEIQSGLATASALATVDGVVDDILADTADMQPKLGTPSNLGSGATLAGNLADIEAQTDDIGVAGAGLTAVPWNAAWDAEVQSEAADALTAYDPPTRTEATSDKDEILTRLGSPAGASVSADVAAVKSQTAAIETDTQDIQGRLPTSLTGGRINANVGAINGTAVDGDGTSGDPWGPAA